MHAAVRREHRRNAARCERPSGFYGDDSTRELQRAGNDGASDGRPVLHERQPPPARTHLQRNRSAGESRSDSPAAYLLYTALSMAAARRGFSALAGTAVEQYEV